MLAGVRGVMTDRQQPLGARLAHVYLSARAAHRAGLGQCTGPLYLHDPSHAHSSEASAIRSDGLTFGSVNFTPASLLLAQQRSHGRPTVVDQASPADNQMLTPRA